MLFPYHKTGFLQLTKSPSSESENFTSRFFIRLWQSCLTWSSSCNPPTSYNPRGAGGDPRSRDTRLRSPRALQLSRLPSHSRTSPVVRRASAPAVSFARLGTAAAATPGRERDATAETRPRDPDTRRAARRDRGACGTWRGARPHGSATLQSSSELNSITRKKPEARMEPWVGSCASTRTAPAARAAGSVGFDRLRSAGRSAAAGRARLPKLASNLRCTS